MVLASFHSRYGRRSSLCDLALQSEPLRNRSAVPLLHGGVDGDDSDVLETISFLSPRWNYSGSD